jgi:hypothetical protein
MDKKISLSEDSFEYAIYMRINPAVKQFLAAYLGDKLLNLEPESYSQIETAMLENIYYHGSRIPDALYQHRTIRDSDEYENAFDNFIKPVTKTIWPVIPHWYDRDFGSSEDEDTYLEDSNDFDLAELERTAKKVVEAADKLINDAQSFAVFMRTGYQALNPVLRQLLEDIASFDLSILDAEGLEKVQKQMDIVNEMILEELSGIVLFL